MQISTASRSVSLWRLTALPLQSGINYHWSDGSDTVYTHWDAVDDDEDIVVRECVYMDVSGGWRREDCETPLPGALCHGPQPSQWLVAGYCWCAKGSQCD